MKYITLIFTSFLLSAPFALSGQTTGRVMSLDELFALADTQSKLSKWTPMLKPVMYMMSTSQRSLWGSSAWSSHLSISQNTTAVNADE